MDAVVYATALPKAIGRGNPGLMPPARQLMPPSRVPGACLGACRHFPESFLFLKVKLVVLVGRVWPWDESAGGRPTLRPTGTSGSRAQLEPHSLLSKKEQEGFCLLFNYCCEALLLVTTARVNTALCSSSSSCDKWLTPVNGLDLTCVGGFGLVLFSTGK